MISPEILAPEVQRPSQSVIRASGWTTYATALALTLGLFLTFCLDAALAASPESSQQMLADGVRESAVLYEEEPSDPKGSQFNGSVVWHTETIKTDGKPDKIAPRADIDIPSRGLRLTMSFGCNLDPSLPATEIINLVFAVPADFNNGGIANVPSILMKPNQEALPTPLAGLSIKVGDGSFLFGLATELSQVKHNAKALQHAWFFLPISYTSQRHATLSIDKGRSGEDVFQTALKTWEQCPKATQPGTTAPEHEDSPGNAR